MGPQTDGSVILPGGGLLWAAAIGFAFGAVLVLALWRRAWARKKTVPQSETAQGLAVRKIENHAGRSIPAETVITAVPEKTEEYGRGGRVLDEPARKAPVSSPVASEISRTSSEETREADAPVVSPAGDRPEAGYDVTDLPSATETVPALANAAVEIAGLAQAGKEGRNELGNGGAIVSEEVIDEGQIATPGEEAEQTEENDEPEERSIAVREGEAEQFAEEPEAGGVETGEIGDEGRPVQYRAPGFGPRKPQRRKVSRSGVTNQDQVLELRVRAVSDRHGFCRFQILARRPTGAPAQLEVHSGRRPVVLSEVADDWYEIAELNDLPGVMERGLRFSGTAGEGDEVSWELRGRDLYVLAELHGIFGFVSTPRLLIGENQIVVCRESRATDIQTILAEAGCDGLQAYGRDYGAPSGWVFFRPVNPSRSVPQVPGDDILNVIRPIPDIEIRLEDGLWLRGSSWIAGYPPKVHIAGEMPSGIQVMIDGEAAEEREARVYVTGGSEQPGSHAVWCAGKSASYEICGPDVSWQEWKGDNFSRRVCGATVAGSGNTRETVASVPTSNPVLIGANPGEVFRCDRRPGGCWTGLVPFPVCWALPEDALHCDRSLRRVLLLEPLPPVHSIAWRSKKKSAQAGVLQWCHAIRDCQRKGLALSPADVVTEQLWTAYKREARAVWRATKQASRS